MATGALETILARARDAESFAGFRALRHRDFRLYAIGQAISLSGSWMQTVAQSWLVYRLTRSEFMLGVTLFATQIPVLFLSPLGGIAADRFSRRRIVLITQTAGVLQATVLAALTLTGAVTVKHIILLAILLGVIQSFDIPARQTLFITMVGRKDLISAISLNTALFNFSRVIGPSLAGILVALFNEGFCFVVNAASYVPMIAGVARMRLEGTTVGGGPPGSLAEGFRFAFGTRELVIILAVVGTLNLSYTPILALAPVFADGIFHMGSAGFGFLVAAMRVGAVVGVIRLAGHTGIGRLPNVIYFSTMAMSISLAVFALSPSYWLAVGMMPVIGFSVMRQNAGGNSLIQTVVPDHYRGRMMALFTMTVTGLAPIGSLAAGALAEKFGARAVVFGGALLCLAATLLYRLTLRRLREWVGRQEEKLCAAV